MMVIERACTTPSLSRGGTTAAPPVGSTLLPANMPGKWPDRVKRHGNESFAAGRGLDAFAAAYRHQYGAIQASHLGVPMSDKSPRKSMSKKSGKSIKEKRADKRADAQSEHDRLHDPKKK
jgi:hypothetical protein